jgi:hypothetical protein
MLSEQPLQVETRCLSSLSKVFADEELKDTPYRSATALNNETFSFQVAYRSNRRKKEVRVSVHSDLAEVLSTRVVGLVPSELPIFEGHDDNLLRSTPGLYPDPLLPYSEMDGLSVAANQWRSVWITVELDNRIKAGIYAIEVTFHTDESGVLSKETFQLEILSASLPDQALIHTEWFHTDCLAAYYGVDVFSEEHWRRIGQFVDTAVRHGMNMILTPMFTPPLDTAVGGERLTVQLVDVEKQGDTYIFGFEQLERWVKLCDEKGIRYFEFSHLFTQWGAKHAPKIMAKVEGSRCRIFGWDTDAASTEYAHFLAQFLPELVRFIRANGLENRSYFHVSDEPYMEHLETYRQASEMLRSHLADFPIIDALSNYAFYENGLVKRPIPASNHMEEFIANNVPDLWTYYCCSQYKDVSNRFMCMPSARNRIIGAQLYKFKIAGFLHWGYNFWNSQFSRKAIDPYKVTDAGLGFPSGDSFLVYPGEEGPIESIRMEVFYEALQDLRAMQLLETLIGRERVIELLEEGLSEPITFDRYPIDLEWVLGIRQKMNRIISEQTR